MALEKSIMLGNGIETNYHKIQSIDVNNIENVAVVTLRSYVSKDIRDIEKAIEASKIELDNLISKASTAAETAKTADDEALLYAMHEKIHDMSQIYYRDSAKQYYAGTIVVNVDGLPEDLSMSSFYKLLTKQYDDLKKAKKV